MCFANLIENINGIEKLSSLSQLDIAINCIIDYNYYNYYNYYNCMIWF